MPRMIHDLEPASVFRYFYEISQIPRPSNHEKAIADYLADFAESRGLEWHRDSADNVVIIKEASPGRETEPAVILQGHMDMVCEKEPDCTKDMFAEGLDLRAEGDWIFAEGTTLGGDDGIAVAYALALLEDETLSHPRLEFLCTTAEEIGMLGASGLDPAPLTGRLLLNLDSEVEGVLTAGCAAGETMSIRLPVERTVNENAPIRQDAGSGTSAEDSAEDAVSAGQDTAYGTPVRILLSGLSGGHSGTAIQFGRANADLLMVRILRDLFSVVPCRLCSLSGGSKNNAIPREAAAEILTEDTEGLKTFLASAEKTLQKEYAVTDPELTLCAEICTSDDTDSSSAEPCSAESPGACPSGSSDPSSAKSGSFENSGKSFFGSRFPAPLSEDSAVAVLSLLSALPNGVQRMDQHIQGFVETSLNLGILHLSENELYAEYLLRSTSPGALEDLGNRMRFLCRFFGAESTCPDKYPAWEYRPESAFREKMVRVFREQYGKDPVVEIIHAGLECGILSEKLPGLDAVSIGPDIPNIHTPKERLSISSVQRTWHYIRGILEAAE